jgi:hypothetical protein
MHVSTKHGIKARILPFLREDDLKISEQLI